MKNLKFELLHFYMINDGIFMKLAFLPRILLRGVPSRKNETLMDKFLSFLVGALFSYSIGFVKLDWKPNADLVLSAVSFLLAFFTQFMYWNSSLLVLYAVYICVGCTFQTMLTIAQ